MSITTENVTVFNDMYINKQVCYLLCTVLLEVCKSLQNTASKPSRDGTKAIYIFPYTYRERLKN